ncbi:hypothetical protein EUGRSUZ_H02314 [Eucalyptus grandis]|uniref:Uncharacterized protein n=2 Tax=Eucalyptus grandis TaxID=71139 RepID=A0ACC3JRD8_EUCGR|nr:hypothetical protein EUGRSUZ_H02314 [Eucalyptus grandis]
MGNCQAAEVAAVAIHHPAGTKVERIYWSVSAHDIMSANPGHYVAQVIAASSQTVAAKDESGGTPARQLRLLRPDDTLHIGQVYRLVSFEGVRGKEVREAGEAAGKIRRGRSRVEEERVEDESGAEFEA